jgi:hypothetical protein
VDELEIAGEDADSGFNEAPTVGSAREANRRRGQRNRWPLKEGRAEERVLRPHGGEGKAGRWLGCFDVLEELDDEGLELPGVLGLAELVEKGDDIGDLLEEVEETLELRGDLEREGEAGLHGVLLVSGEGSDGSASKGESETVKKSSRIRFRRTVIGIRCPSCSRNQTFRR